MIYIGFLHHFQELPRISGQAFHIAALPFRINSVKRKRRLARA